MLNQGACSQSRRFLSCRLHLHIIYILVDLGFFCRLNGVIHVQDDLFLDMESLSHGGKRMSYFKDQDIERLDDVWRALDFLQESFRGLMGPKVGEALTLRQEGDPRPLEINLNPKSLESSDAAT